MRLVITGGAGFVGSSLAVRLREALGAEVVCLDNLKRRGSELSLPRLKRHGITFVHGDVRLWDDLAALPPADVLLECSAEPSVLAGNQGQGRYLVDTNLVGAVNCCEWARQAGAAVVFLSTSRVYPYDRLRQAPLITGETRLLWQGPNLPGAGPEGVSEDFPLPGRRSLYGASKLAAELLLVEYADMYGFPYVINRCGVITGPWQFGKTDQGVFMYWLLQHYLRSPLQYIGYGGAGKQVRDLLHVDDLAELLARQITRLDVARHKTYNVGGGATNSLSLLEATDLCRSLTGHTVPIAPVPEERWADIPWYVSDCNRVEADLGWQPQRTVPQTFTEMFDWIREYREQLLSSLR
ncbi:MAG: NAD-dependent epimerase/dehydratase family protein [Deltaproteobacteria bacterium]|nr:NAD-dependent epimerase/dehydratase family protein [Deltaproteobacteria bacterium]